MEISLKELEIILSTLEDICNPKPHLEQWTTLPRIAAEMLLYAYEDGNIADKTCADFGCGNGILTIGLLILNARRIYAIDIDIDAIKTTRRNLERIAKIYNISDFEERVIILHEDIRRLQPFPVDTIIMNPPFGVEPQTRHADRYFLIKAFEMANVIYSLHHSTEKSRKFLSRLAKENCFESTIVKTFNFTLRARFWFHKHEKRTIKTDFYVFKRRCYRRWCQHG